MHLRVLLDRGVEARVLHRLLQLRSLLDVVDARQRRTLPKVELNSQRIGRMIRLSRTLPKVELDSRRIGRMKRLETAEAC